MGRNDIRPNVRTFTALITALGVAKQWDRALGVLRRMKQQAPGSGSEPNAYTYSGACPPLPALLVQEVLPCLRCRQPSPAQLTDAPALPLCPPLCSHDQGDG